jgi:DNA-binding PadR family transcriptional regulator
MSAITPSEAAILGLLAERPMHGYELDAVIETRGLRAWSDIGFSSIYFHLAKLQKKQLVRQDAAPASPKGRKPYAITAAGHESLAATCLRLLAEPGGHHPPIMIALANWPSLDPSEALAALAGRRAGIEAERIALRKRWDDQRPLPPFVDALFSYGLSQAEAELVWLDTIIVDLGGAIGQAGPEEI